MFRNSMIEFADQIEKMDELFSKINVIFNFGCRFCSHTKIEETTFIYDKMCRVNNVYKPKLNIKIICDCGNEMDIRRVHIMIKKGYSISEMVEVLEKNRVRIFWEVVCENCQNKAKSTVVSMLCHGVDGDFIEFLDNRKGVKCYICDGFVDKIYGMSLWTNHSDFELAFTN